MELLERENFLTQLEAILDNVTAGEGRLVLVSGEAGIGKTSLVERFVEEHKKRARCLWGACDALFTPRALGPLHDIALQTQNNLLTLLEEQAPRASILTAVLQELGSGRMPAIVVIEDVHWADEATLDLLKFLGRRIHRLPSMLIVTYRDDEVGPEHQLRFVLGDLPHRSVTRIRLPPLSEIAVEQLANHAGRRLKDLYTVTGGNPFFITEVLASKEPGVPVTVSDAVLARAARLSLASREVCELVSVVPARAETWLINETISPTGEAVEECLSRGMLRSEGEALAFRHELARRAVEDSLATPRRQNLHAVVLKALLNRRSDALLPRIVHHAAHAGDEAAVLEYAPIAAKQAAALNAHRESASHYQTALRHADKLAPDERAQLLECLSYECYLTGQLKEALEVRGEALKIWKRLGNKLRQGDNLRWMSRLSWGVGHKVEAERYGIEAVTLLEQLPPGPELAMAYSNRAQPHLLAQEHHDAVLWGSRAIELAEKLGATQTLVHALNNVGTAELFAHIEHGRSKLEESLRLALKHNLQDHAARAFANLAYTAVRDRNYKLAMGSLDDGISYSTDHDLDFYRLHMMAWRARAQFDQGDWDRAADDAGYVLGGFQVSTIAKASSLAVLGHLRVRRGDPDASAALAEAHELAMQTGELQWLAPVASAQTEYAWLKGEFEEVMAAARVVLEMAKGRKDPWIEGEFEFWLWRSGEVTKIPEDIAVPYRLQMAGNWRAAAEAWKQIGCPYEEAIALADGDEP